MASTKKAQRAAKRLVFPEPRKVDLQQIEVDVDDLGAYEVVVQARRSVISPGTEVAHYRGDSLSGALPHAQRRGEPFYPGYAMVGTVLAAGTATGLAAGTNVLSHTSHQSLTRFDHRERVCVPLPADIDVDVAPFGRLVQVGGISLQLSSARPGDTVAVVGLGPVGNLVAQLANTSGYRVVGVERSAARRGLARMTGLETVVSPEDAVGPCPWGGAACARMLRQRESSSAGYGDVWPPRRSDDRRSPVACRGRSGRELGGRASFRKVPVPAERLGMAGPPLR